MGGFQKAWFAFQLLHLSIIRILKVFKTTKLEWMSLSNCIFYSEYKRIKCKKYSRHITNCSIFNCNKKNRNFFLAKRIQAHSAITDSNFHPNQKMHILIWIKWREMSEKDDFFRIVMLHFCAEFFFHLIFVRNFE